MKRRNAECGKLRRPLKRNKITEGIYGSTFLYLKFVGIWAFVLLLDFILEFRFEYLWPLWLLLRSIYDSYRYQGLAFSVFFVFIAFTSDMICLLFIPVHWLFFAASTYVWVQFVWHTDRGICLPTVSLWLLFVYIEASVRLRELRSALPFHLDLCRPFAAHCIGYPVVTLGFGFKSYVGYRMRLRKQKDVQKENDFYMQLLQQALPPEQQTSSSSLQQPEKTKVLSAKSDEPTTNGIKNLKGSPASNHTKDSGGGGDNKSKESRKHQQQVSVNNAGVNGSLKSSSSADSNYLETNSKLSQRIVNDYDGTKENVANELVQAKKQNIGGSSQRGKNQSSKENSSSGQASKKPKPLSNRVENKEKEKDTNLNADVANGSVPQSSMSSKEEKIIRGYESDIKKLKADLQASRQTESVLRSELNSTTNDEQRIKSELEQLKRDNESLQTKLHNLVTQKQQDKQNLSKMEKNVKTERETRTTAENLLKEERKNRKAEEAAAARAVALATANSRMECSDSCRARQLDQDKEILRLRGEQHGKDERLRDLEKRAEQLHERQESQGKTELLMSALMAMQDKTAKLETSLSAETRLKLDLFSALGDARRQLEIYQGQLMKKEQEIHDLKSKIAEVMAVMPPGSYSGTSQSTSSNSGTQRYFSNNKIEGSVEPLVNCATPTSAAINCAPSPVGPATSVSSGAITTIPALPASSGGVVSDAGVNNGGGGSSSASSGSPAATPEPQCGPGSVWDQAKSNLDPNAACYRPKSN